MTQQNNNYTTGYNNQVSLSGTGISISEHNRNQVYDMFVKGKITSAQYHQFIYEKLLYQLTDKDNTNE